MAAGSGAAGDLDAALQRVTRPVASGSVRGRSFAVVGGKGGVGCTTIAVNLAAAIRNASREPTLLLDLHLAQGDASVFLGVEPRFTVLDALENIHRLDDTYFKGLITPHQPASTCSRPRTGRCSARST